MDNFQEVQDFIHDENQRDMLKINVARQFSEAGGPQGIFSRKQKLYKVLGEYVYLTLSSLSFFVRSRGLAETDTPTDIILYVQIKENTHRLRHVDFDITPSVPKLLQDVY